MAVLVGLIGLPGWIGVGSAQVTRGVMELPDIAPGSVPIAGQYWALIIGIDKYEHAPKLETAVNDARGVSNVLQERYGFRPDHITELFDEQATRNNIETALYTLAHNVGKDDSLFIYYAGHGQYDEEEQLGWWVPVEAQPTAPGMFITNASIRDYINSMKARHVYLVADSCFSGTLFGGTRSLLPPLNDQFFNRLYTHPSRWGLTSGGKEPVADQGKNGHSFFAYLLLNLLKENTNPYLVPSHIFDQLAPLLANNSSQTPRSEPLKGTGDEGGQFVFQLVQPVAPSFIKEQDRHKKESDIAKTSGTMVHLERPSSDSSVVGPLLLSWTTEELAQDNLLFEVSLTEENKPARHQVTARNSIVPQGIKGKVQWKVRPIWQIAGQPEKYGEWTPEQSFTYYHSRLDRIIDTKTIHVGIAEPDDFFVKQEGGELSGYEIELLRELITKILIAKGITTKPIITYTRRIWGEEFFQLLERNGDVDLLASGISITPDREKAYGFLFTNPTLVFPQALITKPEDKAFSNGALALSRVGVVEKTTNEDLARKLVAASSKSVVVPYKGSGAYDRILADLVTEKIDGALIDKPYALKKVAVLKRENGQDLTLTDITAKIVPGIQLEKMGFAVRKSDRAFLQELNLQLTGPDIPGDGVLSKLIPGWSQ